MKKKLKLLKHHGPLLPGVYTFSGKLADHLLRTGKAVEHKEEKKVYETKEEKFIPENKYADVAVSKLDVSVMSNEDLKGIIALDARKTAVAKATEELDKR